MIEMIAGLVVGWLLTRAYYQRSIEAMFQSLSLETAEQVYSELSEALRK